MTETKLMLEHWEHRRNLLIQARLAERVPAGLMPVSPG
jgi:hypothetical protein